MSSAIDERITELVAAHRDQLEQLVREKVDAELERLVEAELERRENSANPSEALTAAPARLCSICGEREPQRHRTVCGRCRERQKRERRAAAQAAEAEPPRTGGDHGG